MAPLPRAAPTRALETLRCSDRQCEGEAALISIRLSQQGAVFIAGFEGFSPVCYDDGGRPGLGNCTIGFGHLIHYGPTRRADREHWGEITRPHGLELLDQDARAAALAVAAHVQVAISQPFADALISAVYNAGPGLLQGQVGQAVNAKPRLAWPLNIRPLQRWRQRVAYALLAWDHVNGVVVEGLRRRRLAEGWLIERHAYTRGQGNPYV